MEYNQIKTIRYMWNKNKLLDFIIPEIKNITKEWDVICDLMAWSWAVAYALKDRNTVYFNDVQYYSYIIGKWLIENNSITTNKKQALLDLESNYLYNKNNKEYSFFERELTDTYFSWEQCLDIDSIRYAIDKLDNEYLQALYMIALMFSMSKCESTSWHFAQYLPKEHKRLVELRAMNIRKEFLEKCDEFSDIVMSWYNNKSFNMEYKKFFESEDFKKVDCFYIDTPYTWEQYSRFYHILETVTKYDNPELKFKWRYREDRFMSNFSLRSKVKQEFIDMLDILSKNYKKAVLSYSNRWLVSVEELNEIFQDKFRNVRLIYQDYNHSTQWKWSIKLEEVLFISYN